MKRVFNNLEEMKRYYDEETNTYNFRGRNYLDKVILNFDLNVESNIEAYDIKAISITAKNIQAWNITAWEINACDIDSNDIDAGVIRARDINALAIKSMDIYARDIDAYGIDGVNIYARDIIYSSTCSAYDDFKCNSIKCKRNYSRNHSSYYTIYGKLEVIQNGK